MAAVEFLAITLEKEKEVLQRCQKCCEEFGYTMASEMSIEKFAEHSENYDQVPFVMLSAVHASQEESAGMVQVIRQILKDAFIMIVVDRKVPPEVASFVKKSGANIVILEDELLNTSKLEYVASQRVRASYLPIKSAELKVDTEIPFTVYHLMPLNQKFLPVVIRGVQLNESRRSKLESVGEVYIRREDLDKYRKYIDTYQDKTAAGLKSRCRAQFLTFCDTYVQLVMLLTDQSEYASFQAGKDLYERCSTLASDVIMSLGAVGEAWEIINNSSIGEFGSIERAPAIAAYAGLFSLMSGIGEPKDVMISALVADVALIDLDPKTTKILRNIESMKLNDEQRVEYERHPLSSLNKGLSRRLPIPENVKQIIISTHEQADQKGFPNKPRSEKIPAEASLIQFSELIDQNCIIRMGKARVDYNDVKKQIFNQEYLAANRFSLLFLEKIKSVIF